MTDIAVVIPNHDGAGLVGQCVSAVREAGAAEVVVVDDHSTDDSAREAADAGATVVSSRGRGFSAAVNTGVAATSAPILLILNSDCFVDPDALDRLCGAIEADDRVGLCGAALSEPDGSRSKSHGALVTLGVAIRTALTGLGGAVTPSQDEGVQHVPFVPLACVMTRREVWDRLGGLDERFFFYFEDHDICKRVQEADLAVAVCWDAHARHVGGGSSSARNPERWFRQYNESRALYLRKHYPRGFLAFAAVWVPCALVRATVWLVRRRPDSRSWAAAYLKSATAGLRP